MTDGIITCMRKQLTVLATLTLTTALLLVPGSAAAKCSDDMAPGLVCARMSIAFSPVSAVTGEETTVTVRWLDERTGEPVTDSMWLARRGSPIYFWVWDHEPEPGDRYVGSVRDGTLPMPEDWVVLDWNGSIYQGAFTFPEAGPWYYSAMTDAPVEGLESDTTFGYVGAVNSIEVWSPAPSPGTWAFWGPALFGISVIALVILGTAAFAVRHAKGRQTVRHAR